jgi:hypothetical protein
MSVTFEAMLIVVLHEDETMRELNRLLHIKDEQRHQQFNKLDTDHAGGSKVFGLDVWAACFNHLIPDDVEDCIAAAPWRDPQWVMYVRDLGDYHYDEETGFTAMTVAELRASREDLADES